MPAPLKLTVLGSGTSMGVPSLGCHCRVCSSTDPRDKRLRPSLLLSRGGKFAVIDTTPDFRQQALRANLDRLDAVLLTHGHADHIMGFDDIRPYNLRQQISLPVFANDETHRTIRRAFAYIFDGKPKLSSIPSVTLREANAPFDLLGIKFTPIPLIHGDLEVLGFRFARAAYITDFSSIPDSSLPLLSGLDELILDALRDTPHPMHQTVDQALALISKLNPRRAWFTHIAHDLSHAETIERMHQLGFPNVVPAYDGLEIEVQVEEVQLASSGDIANASGSGDRAFSPFFSSQEWSAHFAASSRGSTVAIGNFDGIHLGHQAILRAAVSHAGDIQAVPTVLTFDPPPQKILRPESAPLRLSTQDQRLHVFADLGVEAAVVLPFTHDLARLSPQEFVDRILLRDLQVRAVFVGENFRFGYRQSGDASLLRRLGAERGFDVVIVPQVVHNGQIVSSTRIRQEISAGQVTPAARLLDRPFILTGKVVSGTGTGRRFTFPTLNLVPEQELLPARGVYITRTRFEGESRSHRSVTNIGIRPTFNGSSVSVETHILEPIPEGSPGHIEVEFWKRLRDEKKFSSPEELRAQIAHDISAARRFFTRLRRLRSRSLPTNNASTTQFPAS